ncbi:SRPBCC domain-containing protein [Alicyclobacillus fastidiosus]|uniref:SRPBCC domain-containing protein n=1 Tax=Alicyclobacillus fastidiosus TaxID=392011 RepID=A0ABV5AIS4_9BACL|nr:SRPBCC domain-containing protein [Alicyclobacillus fastidiosus]WEH10124.1 SRPBCC domain-containing protein [Alicyclobacillus fastidiosus]
MNSDAFGNVRLIRGEGDWILVLERTMDHRLEDVFAALTEAEQIPSWAPFTTDRDLVTTGRVRLAHIDMPEAPQRQGEVLEVSAPRLLVLRWGDDILRWELSGDGEHTGLILRHHFADRKEAPSYAAGWHLCLDGLAGALAGEKLPSMVGRNAMKHGWQTLYEQYAEAFRDTSTT